MKRTAYILALAGAGLAARRASEADWENIRYWLWWSLVGERVYVTYQHDQYYVVLFGPYMNKLKRRHGAMGAGVGKTLSEALASAAKIVQAMEQYAARPTAPKW